MNAAQGRGKKRPHGATPRTRGAMPGNRDVVHEAAVVVPAAPDEEVAPAPLPLLVADPDEEFSGREIRRLTARVTASRADAGRASCWATSPTS
ncbi:hypothetical protein NKG05_01035 [Oerskovia sp. M15]